MRWLLIWDVLFCASVKRKTHDLYLQQYQGITIEKLELIISSMDFSSKFKCEAERLPKYDAELYCKIPRNTIK